MSSSDEAHISIKHLHRVDQIRADEGIEYNLTIVQSSNSGSISILLYNVTKSRHAEESCRRKMKLLELFVFPHKNKQNLKHYR